ncbi:hypothetical protein [Streptosporangium amethystogenes]|uniref:hypothetical protein n=1 Tax=Streptosporangium amethystogenes TaxID=2002 RepID=UPI00068C8B45|nr:hypothetical protein [Streptosporangium amethystogenes]
MDHFAARSCRFHGGTVLRRPAAPGHQDEKASLRKLDDQHGGGALSLRYITSELRNVLDLVQCADYEPAVGHQLLTIVADLAQLVGWVHFDAQRPGAAERYLLLSERIARGLGELGRAANAIGMLAYISAFTGRVATAAASAGDLSTFRQAAEKARQLLDSAEVAPTYLYYLEPDQLTAETGQALVVLGEQMTVYRKPLLNEAIGLLSPISAVGARPDYPRSALLHGTFLTHAHLLRGDMEAAVDAGRAALTRLDEVQSVRALTYLRRLRPAFAHRSRSPKVAAFLPHLDTALAQI